MLEGRGEIETVIKAAELVSGVKVGSDAETMVLLTYSAVVDSILLVL